MSRFSINKPALLCLSLLLIGCSPNEPLKTTQSKQTLSNELNRLVPTLMVKARIPALSIAVVRGGKLEFTASFGSLNDNRGPVTENTVFEAASLGKPVFALLVLKLAEAGVLDLAKPLSEQTTDPRFRQPELRHITPRMILTHTSGLGKTTPTKSNEATPELEAPFEYSSRGYNLLQNAIEQKTGKSLEELAQKYVFQPLKMASSSFEPSKPVHARKAIGTDDNGKPIKPSESQTHNLRKASAASSLHTTSADYGRFIASMMTGRHAFSQAATQMQEPVISITNDIAWGLGWGIQRTRPNRSFWHWGSNPGYRSYVVGYPTEGIGVVVLSNSSIMFKFVDDIIKAAIGGALPSYDWF